MNTKYVNLLIINYQLVGYDYFYCLLLYNSFVTSNYYVITIKDKDEGKMPKKDKKFGLYMSFALVTSFVIDFVISVTNRN